MDSVLNYIKNNKVFLLLVVVAYFVGMVVKYLIDEPAVHKSTITLVAPAQNASVDKLTPTPQK